MAPFCRFSSMICSFLVPLWSISPNSPGQTLTLSGLPHPSWPLITASPTLGLGVHRDGCVSVCGNSWARWASPRPAPQPLVLLFTFSPQRQLLCPQDPSQLWKALPGENQLSPKLPQDGATNSRLGFCQLLQGEKNAEQDKVSQETAGRPPPQASSVPSGVTLAPPGWPSGPCFHPCSRCHGLAPTSSRCPSPCCLSLLAHLPASLSICLSLPPSLLSPSLHLCYLSSSSSANLMLLHLTQQVHLKKKTLMCVYLLGCSGS